MPDVNILINATNKASGPIKQVGGEIDGLGNKANNAAKGGLASFAGAVGTALKVGAAAGVTALGALGAAVGVTGTNFNNMRQQAQIAFTTMLGDGGKAKVFLDDLQQFAASTPFEFPELVSASQKLLAMGFAAEDVKPTLTAVGDAVAGLGGGGEMVGRVTTALGQMQAKGKASAEEMMQITEAGIPGWEMLAKKIGVDIPTAMDMVSKGAVSADVAIGALVDGMTSDFGGLMDAQSKTFGGLLSTLKDTFAQVSGQVMQPFFEKMTTGLQMIVDWTSSPSFTSGVAQLTQWLQMAADAASVFFGDLMAGQSVVEAATHALRLLLPPAIFNTWTQFTDVIDSVFNALQLLVTGDFTGGIFGFSEDHPAITALFVMRQSFTGLMDVIAGKVSFLEHIGSLWSNIWDLGKQAFAYIVDYVTSSLPAWQAQLAEWGNAAWRWISDIAIPAIGEKLTEWRTKLTDWVTTNLPAWKNALLAWAKTAWQWIVDSIPAAVDKLKQWGASLMSWLGNALPTFLKTLLQWGTALYTWIGEAIPKAIDGLAGFVRGLREKGDGEGGNEFAQMAQGWAGKLWRWIREDLIPAVGPAFSDFIRSMLNYGNKLLVSLGSLAKELGLTLWDWIVTITPVAVKKIGEWGGALWGWIKTNAPSWKDRLAEWGALAWQWIRDVAIPQAKIKVEEWGKMLWDWVKTNAPLWKDKLLQWGAAAWEWIRDVAIPQAKIKLEEWGTRLLDWLKTNWPIWRDNMVSAGKEMIDGLRDGIEIMWIRLTDWFFSDTAFGGFVGDIMEMLGIQLGPAYGVMYKNGERVAYSLNEGSRYGLNSLKQTGSDMGTAISSGLEQNMDMHSPSRVMWGYGENITASLQGGINAGVAGLKSEMQYVADTIKATMQRANDEMLASVEYFTNQALVKAQAAHYKIANAAQDASAILKKLGIDASQSVGVGPNGELILKGVTNLPTQTNPVIKGAGTSNGNNFVPLQTEIKTLGSALGTDVVTAQTAAESIKLLGGLTLQTVDLAKAKEDVNKAVESSAKTLNDFIAGIGDFLSGTLTGANKVFSYFKYEEEKAYREGTLKEFMSSETAQTKTQLKGLYQGLQNSIADILGISTSDLNVTGGDSKRLIDRIKQLTSGTNADTNMEFIGSLLQSAVNFRNLSNFGTGAEYFKDILPTDGRLTGGSSTATTNNFNITLAPGATASDDLISTFNLLNSMYGTAAT